MWKWGKLMEAGQFFATSVFFMVFDSNGINSSDAALPPLNIDSFVHLRPFSLLRVILEIDILIPSRLLKNILMVIGFAIIYSTLDCAESGSL